MTVEMVNGALAGLELDGRLIRLGRVDVTGRAIARSVEGIRERATVLVALAGNLDAAEATQAVEGLDVVDVARLVESIDPTGTQLLRDAGDDGPLRPVSS